MVLSEERRGGTVNSTPAASDALFAAYVLLLHFAWFSFYQVSGLGFV